MKKIVLLAVMLAAAPSFAEEEKAEAESEENEKISRFHVGVHGSVRGSFSGGESEAFYGGGAFLTYVAIHKWLEIELVVDLIAGSHEIEDSGVKLQASTVRLPIDLLLKKPFHISKHFHPFVGIGPTLVYEHETFSGGAPSAQRWSGGGTAVAGVDIWISRHAGLVLEAAYSLLAANGIEHEVGGSLGALIEF